MDEKYDLIYPRNLARAILGEEPEVYPDAGIMSQKLIN